MKSKMKYVVIIVGLLGMIYAKNKIESNNEAKIQMIDSLEDDS